MRVRLTRRAAADLMSQISWLEDRSPAAARRAAQLIRSGLARLADFPLAAPSVDKAHRDAAIRFGRDGLVVRYRVEGDLVIVVRIFHGRQRR